MLCCKMVLSKLCERAFCFNFESAWNAEDEADLRVIHWRLLQNCVFILSYAVSVQYTSMLHVLGWNGAMAG